MFFKSKPAYYSKLQRVTYSVKLKEDKDDVEKREEEYYKIFAVSASVNIEERLRRLQELKSNV